MAIINVSTQLPTNGNVAQSTDVSTPINTIVSDYNGNITNANISTSAGIVDTKLDQISTGSKVNGSALTSLASIPSSAGFIPIENLASGTTGVGNFLQANQTWVSVTTGALTSFGSWASGGTGTTLASTAGFVSAYGDIPTGCEIQGYTDGSTPPTTLRQKVGIDDGTFHGGFLMPVKKNDYWKISISGSVTGLSIFWLPLQ